MPQQNPCRFGWKSVKSRYLPRMRRTGPGSGPSRLERVSLVSRFVVFVVLTLLFVAAACSSPTSPSPELRGGVVATFQVGQDQFKVFVRNPSAIDRLLALQRGAPGGSIPNGRILRGSGAGAHNAPRAWHLDPVDIDIADATIELCDGSLAYVDANLTEYVEVVKRYCPWGARLVGLTDHR